MTILIAGGGIAGLTMALTCHQMAKYKSAAGFAMEALNAAPPTIAPHATLRSADSGKEGTK